MAIIDKSKKRFVQDRDKRVSIGIDWPFRLSSVSGSGYFAQTSTTADAIKNNVRNLLSTQKGERFLQPEIGLNLQKFLFEQINNDTILAIEADIISTFARWMPFVEVQDIDIDISESNSSGNKIAIDVTFLVNRDPSSLSSVQVNIGG